MIRAFAAIVLMIGAPAQAQELDMPEGAKQTASRNSALDSYALPEGVYDGVRVPVSLIEGPVVREAWRIEGTSATTLQLLTRLRDQLLDADYQLLLDCANEACGGFDFRFGIEVLPAPNMVVNLRDYHFVSAIKGPKQAPLSAITALVSRTDTAAFVQVIRVGAPKPVSPPLAGLVPDGVEVTAPVVIGDMTEALTRLGHVVLHDLAFETGSAKLGPGPFGTLENLAQFLKQNPRVQVALVGHTDAVGSLAGNIALSKSRAQSVAQVLIRDFGIPESQLEAEGMGYLSPVASNLLEAGRKANRRVEVVLLRSTQPSD